MPSLEHIQDALNITERKHKHRKGKKQRKVPRRKPSSSEDSDTGSSSSSESSAESDEESSDEDSHRKKHKGKLKSGLYQNAANSHIISNEWYAHAALDDEIGGNKFLPDLSFNLFVAGELEIIMHKNTNPAQRDTRLQLLKILAYKHEHLSKTEILSQYSKFLHRIEIGRFRWGSKRALRHFEQQLVFCIAIENKHYRTHEKQAKLRKFEERKKYCLEYNKGTCKFDKAHEGKINGQIVNKLHICKRCLVESNVEAYHPEKDCERAA